MSRILDYPIQVSLEKGRIDATWTNDTAIWVGVYDAKSDPTLEAVLLEERKKALAKRFEESNLFGPSVEFFEAEESLPDSENARCFNPGSQLLRVTTLLIPSGDYSALPFAGTMRMRHPTLQEFLQSRVERDLRAGGAAILNAFNAAIVK